MSGMDRLQIILRHLQSHITSRSNTTTNIIKSHMHKIEHYEISKQYVCRLVQKSDYSAILELCEDVYDANDFIPPSFHEWLNDKTGNIIFFGLEYKPQSQIIATAICKVIDGGKTGMMMGMRIHPNHRGKRLSSPFTTWVNNMVKQTYPNMIRRRFTSYLSNAASLRAQNKEGAMSIKNMRTFIYGDITFPSNKSNNPNYKAGIMRPDTFEKRLANLKLMNDGNIKLDIISNMDEIIDLLRYKYNKNELYLDWKVYDLMLDKQGMDFNKAVLKKQMLLRRLTVYCNDNQSVMCLLYVDGRKRLTQIHVYGVHEVENEENILFMIAKMYKQWKNRIYSDVVMDVNNGMKFWFFVDEGLVENNSRLAALCSGFDIVVITEKKIVR
eukprot:88875_1